MHYFVPDLTNLIEVVTKDATVGIPTHLIPVVWLLEQSEILAKREVLGAFDLTVIGIIIDCSSQLLSGECPIERFTQSTLDLADKEERRRQFLEPHAEVR